MEESFAGRRATVMGLGTFGAGLAAARFLARAGARVTVTDLRPAEELSASLAELSSYPDIRLHLGRHDERDFVETDLLVVSPAVKPGNRFVQLAVQAGVRTTSEIRLFWDRCRAPIIGVTGSNGKSTTATLIHDILAADGRRVWLGGNIGRSLLLDAGRITPDDWVVLELSSFQLADLNVDRHSPHVAVITGLCPNHLDWHGSLKEYVRAKQTVLRWQSPDDLVIRPREGLAADWPAIGRCCWCGTNGQAAPSLQVWLDESDLRLHLTGRYQPIPLTACPGLDSRHLRSAAMLAATTASALEVPTPAIRTALENFTGLPHRLQPCGPRQGRRFINDSASTTPESTIAALQSVEAPILIVGGTGKGSPLQELAAAILRHARVAIVIGEVCETLIDEVTRVRGEHRRQTDDVLESIVRADDLPEAFELARQHSRTGETILFSPGFASGTMFGNFAERGECFLRLVGSQSSRGL